MPPTAAVRFPSRTKKIDRRAGDEGAIALANTGSLGSRSIDEIKKGRKLLERCAPHADSRRAFTRK